MGFQYIALHSHWISNKFQRCDNTYFKEDDRYVFVCRPFIISSLIFQTDPITAAAVSIYPDICRDDAPQKIIVFHILPILVGFIQKSIIFEKLHFPACITFSWKLKRR